MKTGKWMIFFLLISIIAVPFSLWAQSYRDALPAPPSEIYKSMLQFLEQKEYSKIEGSLNVLGPVLSHIKGKFNVDAGQGIKEGLSIKDDNKIREGVYRLVLWDTRDLFDEAIRKSSESSEGAKVLLKIAYMNYIILSQPVQKKDFSADQRIKKAFQSAYSALGTGSLYSREEGSSNGERLKKVIGEIEGELTRVFSFT